MTEQESYINFLIRKQQEQKEFDEVIKPYLISHSHTFEEWSSLYELVMESSLDEDLKSGDILNKMGI